MVKRKRPGRPKSEIERKPIFSLTGSDTYKEWLDALAASCGLPLTLLFAQSVQEYAEKRKFQPPPKR